MKSKKTLTRLLTLIVSCALIFTGCAGNTPAASQASAADNTQPAAAEPAAAIAPEEPVTVAVVTEEATPAVGYITLDINPSIQLTVDAGVVTDVVAYNDDGAAIAVSTNVIGMTPHEAVDALVAELAAQDYITQDDEAALVITVSGCENDGLAEGLKDRARERIQEMNMECEIVSAAVSPEDVEAAQALGLSVGRYLVIKHIAEQEGITLEEAIDAYSSNKMKDLLGMVDETDGIFENDEDFEAFLDTLTPEQRATLTAAVDTYKTTVKDAQKAFIQAGKDAQKYFRDEKKKAQEAFKETHDTDAWKQAKTALKEQFSSVKAEAKAQAKAAKEAAMDAFLEAVSGLGLSEDMIAELTAYVFDFEWEDMDFDDVDLDEDEDDEDEDDEDKDDEDKDDEDEDDNDKDDDDKGEGKGPAKDNSGKGNNKNKADDDEDEDEGDDEESHDENNEADNDDEDNED